MKKHLFCLIFAALIFGSAAAEIKIRGTSFGNWCIVGETMAFTADETLKDDVQVAVTVFNAAGTAIQRSTISGKEFKSSGFKFLPPHAGFYEAEFSLDGKILSEFFTAEAKRHSAQSRSVMETFAKQQIHILRHGFYVAPAPTRPAREISRIFSSSPHMEFYPLALPLAKLVGFHSIRIHHVPWCVVEPEQGKFDWRYPDGFMKCAKENGFGPENIIVNTFNTPRWASPHPEEDWFDNCITVWGCYAPTNFDWWRRYLTELVKRYPGLKAVELMNEPNFPGFSCFWHDTPENFFKLIQTGYEAVKSASPGTEVWMSGGINPNYYENYLRKTGGKYYDVIPVHGNTSPAGYRSAERLAKVPHKPVTNSEWHACLVNPQMSDFPSDRELARKMILSFLTQAKAGIEEICLFSIMNIWNSERESLQFYKDNNHLAIHVSGLFRRAPYAQPRYMAGTWHVFTSLVQGSLKVSGEYASGNQRAVLIESDAAPFVIFWNTAKHPEKADSRLLHAAQNRQVLHADGAPVDLKQELLNTDSYYILCNPDLNEIRSWQNQTEFLTFPEERAVLDQSWQGNYITSALFNENLEELKHQAPWHEISRKVVHDTNLPSGNLKAAFAAGITDGQLELLVKVQDPVFFSDRTGEEPWNGDSLQFCIDTRKRGIRGDQAEFVISCEKDGRTVLRKVQSPAIGGDLPSKYTPRGKHPGAEIRYGKARISRQNGITTYRVRIDLVEFYPLVFRPGDDLRIALLVNNNDGKGRAAYWEWAGGIGGSKLPELYGTLRPFTGKKEILKQKDLNQKWWKKDFTLTVNPGSVRVDCQNSMAAAVGAYTAQVTPGGTYLLRFTARGNASLILKATGKDVELWDITPLVWLSEEWKTFEYQVKVPVNGSDFAMAFLAWDQKRKFFEIKDFSLKGL